MKHEELQELIKQQTRDAIKAHVNSSVVAESTEVRNDILNEGVGDWLKRKFGITNKAPKAVASNLGDKNPRRTLANMKIGSYKLTDVDKTLKQMLTRYKKLSSNRSELDLAELEDDFAYLERVVDAYESISDNAFKKMTKEEIEYLSYIATMLDEVERAHTKLHADAAQASLNSAKKNLSNAKGRRNQ